MNTNEELGAASAETELAQLAPERMQMAASQVAYWQLFQAIAGQLEWRVADDPRAAFSAREAEVDAAAMSPTTDLPQNAQSPADSTVLGGRALESQVLGLIQAMAAFAPPAAALTTTAVGDRMGFAMQIAVDAR